MLRQFRLFLGVERFNMLVGLLLSTGIFNIGLQFVEADWVPVLQTLLALVFIIGAALIVGSRLPPGARGTWAAILVPAIGLIIIGSLFLPDLLPLLLGAAVGWLVAGSMIFGRTRAPMKYREAIKFMRKQDYKEAAAAITSLIKAEPDRPEHYALRARIHRLWNKAPRARKDYEQMLNLSDNAAMNVVAYNGLSELELQQKNYEKALIAAEKAAELAPDDPVAFYNLGMIQDRLEQSDAAIVSLKAALDKKMRDKRHRLLIYVYLIRAYVRTDDMAAAEDTLAKLKQMSAGLKEWQVIMESEEAAVLRSVLEDDVNTAAALMQGDMTLNDLMKDAVLA
ncbi:MAG: tetratricopeptide repeat protein [Aggregatilineales bacterium]